MKGMPEPTNPRSYISGTNFFFLKGGGGGNVVRSPYSYFGFSQFSFLQVSMGLPSMGLPMYTRYGFHQNMTLTYLNISLGPLGIQSQLLNCDQSTINVSSLILYIIALFPVSTEHMFCKVCAGLDLFTIWSACAFLCCWIVTSLKCVVRVMSKILCGTHNSIKFFNFLP